MPSLGGLEPPTFRLTAERANRLRHRDELKRSGLLEEYNNGYDILDSYWKAYTWPSFLDGCLAPIREPDKSG